jgi:hypothetical protein
MPGDPKECRKHARNCSKLARHAASLEAREHFASLHASWLRLAAEIESGQSLLDVINDIEVETPPKAEAAE